MMMVYEIFNENELIMNCKYFRQQIPFSVSPTLLFSLVSWVEFSARAADMYDLPGLRDQAEGWRRHSD